MRYATSLEAILRSLFKLIFLYFVLVFLVEALSSHANYSDIFQLQDDPAFGFFLPRDDIQTSIKLFPNLLMISPTFANISSELSLHCHSSILFNFGFYFQSKYFSNSI